MSAWGQAEIVAAVSESSLGHQAWDSGKACPHPHWWQEEAIHHPGDLAAGMFICRKEMKSFHLFPAASGPLTLPICQPGEF